MGYENSFIAAEKGSPLIKEWLDLFLKIYSLPFDKIMGEFK